jgi:diguanylate cyclase
MRFYLASSFIFPRSFRLRLFALCFLATHVPLLTYLGWGAATGRLALAEFVLLTLATVTGTAIALLGIGAMLSPIHAAQEALASLKQGDAVQTMPQAREDVVGNLLASVNRAAGAAEARARALDLAAKEDVLTGVPNRRGFLAAVGELPEEEQNGALALIDLDYFKQINDRLGHEEGDRVLRGFAGRLSSGLRRGDVVARWGGEEFAVFFRDATEADAAGVLARIAGQLMVDPLVVLDGRVLTFSAGVCRFRDAGLNDTLRRADRALYEAKHAGGNRVMSAGRIEQGVLPLA